MTNEAKISYLNRAAWGYLAGGLCVLYGGIRYWFSGADIHDDPLLKSHHVWGIVKQINDFPATLVHCWNVEMAAIAMLVAHHALWKTGEPTGMARRWLLLLPLAGSVCHLAVPLFPFPFAPLGTVLNALGMLIVGIASFRVGIWTGWQRFAPLGMGLFNLTVQLPLLLLLHTPPYQVIPIWGVFIGLVGLAARQRARALGGEAFASAVAVPENSIPQPL